MGQLGKNIWSAAQGSGEVRNGNPVGVEVLKVEALPDIYTSHC
jgi:hypothetical protein